MIGTARDSLTINADDAPVVLAQDRLHIRVDPHKIITSIATDPPIDGINALVGTSVIAGYRKRLRAIPAVAAVEAQPIALLLDDLVGCNIISGWVWSKWIDDAEELQRWTGDPAAMMNACVGYAPGASVFDGGDYLSKIDPVPSLVSADDRFALHPLAPDSPQTMRRVRVIDVQDDGDAIVVAAMFQDSGMVPGNRRSAVHEYALRARIDAASRTVRSLDATPGVLPHRECVRAPAGLAGLIGTPLETLRDGVLRDLRGVAGCTHLNDAVRSLAEAPLLLRARDAWHAGDRRA